MLGPIVIAGASGTLGRALAAHARSTGREVRTIGRSWESDARWNEPDALRGTLDGAALLVNFAGRGIDCRYDDRHRAEILDSRVSTTTALRDAVAATADPPPVWLNASTASVYRHALDAPRDEHDAADQPGFLEDVGRAWEAAMLDGDAPRTRRVPLRITFAFGDAPAARLLLRLARLGLGGPQHDGWWLPHARYRGIGVAKDAPGATEGSRGSATHGKQMFSWIHVDDVLGAIDHVEQHAEITGPVNLAAPEAVPNNQLMRTLREAVGMPIGIPSTRWMLEPAMWALRTESDLVLPSRWVAPGVLDSTGYAFRHATLASAADETVQRMRRSRS